MDLLEFMTKLDIEYYLEVKNVIPYSTGLDLISVKSGIIYIISHNYAKIKVDSYDSLPLEKTMTFCNVIILIKSLWNKDKNSYYCIFRKSFL